MADAPHKANMLQGRVQVTQTSITDAIFKHINTLNFHNPVSIIKTPKCFLFWNFLLGDGDMKM